MIEAIRIHKTIDKFTLNDISFYLPKGYILGIIGRNGSGKTSLLKILLNLYKPEDGILKIDGTTYNSNEIFIRNMTGVVLTESLFEEELSLSENATKYGRFFPLFDQQIFHNYLNRFQLNGNKKVYKLSKGEQLKFQFAFALSYQPRLLILDEPTGNFDPQFREEFWNLLKEFVADGEKSVVLATHITNDLERYADYLLYLENGNCIFYDDIETFRKSYLNLAIEEVMYKREKGGL